MRVLLLHNPQAGAGDHREQDVVRSVKMAGVEVDYCSTKSDDFPDCLSRDFDMAIIAGGDGTVAECARRLRDRSKPLGIIPLGGANNVARSLGFDRWSVIGGALLGKAETRAFWMGRIERKWSVNTFIEGIGVGALAKSFRAKSRHEHSVREKLLNGRRHFAVAVAELDPIDVDVTVDGDELAGRWLMAEALTLSQTGPRLPLAPSSQGLKGRLSIVLLDVSRRLDMLEWLNNPEAADPPVTVRTGASVSFGLNRNLDCRIDDATRIAGRGRIDVGIDIEPLRFVSASSE